MFDFSKLIDGNASLLLVFLYGLVTSFHCVGMCGGFIIGGSIAAEGDSSDRAAGNRERSAASLRYNAGRLLSYTATGALAGGFGHFFAITGPARAVVPLAGGIVLALMGLEFSGIFRKLKIRLPSLPISWIAKVPRKTFLLGLASAVFPCGPLQAMQFYCLASGSFARGALAMLAFVAGTVPLLFALGIAGSAIPPRLAAGATRVSGTILLVMGIAMAARGVTLTGVRIDVSSILKQGTRTVTALPRGDTQLVVTSFTTEYYPELRVVRGVPVRWVINVDKRDVGKCSATLDVPDFGIRATFHEGANVFEFVPDKSGVFPYQSQCGMLSSSIVVTNDDKGGSS